MSSKINSIQVLGSGCSTCKNLFKLTQEAVNRLSLGVEVEYINDIQKIIELGVMSSPVLVVNGEVVLAGRLPNLDELKKIISDRVQVDESLKLGDCFCDGNC